MADLTLRIAIALAGLMCALVLLAYVAHLLRRHARPRRSVAEVAAPGRHRMLPAAEAQLAGVWRDEVEVFRSGEHPIVVDPVVPCETQRSDFARRLFESDPLYAPVLPDVLDDDPAFFGTVELLTLTGVLGVDAAADLDTDAAFRAAEVRRMLAQRVDAR